MDAGEITALGAVIGGILTYFGAGDVVPFVGPAIQGGLAVFSLVMAIWTFVSHRQKNDAMVAAGISR